MEISLALGGGGVKGNAHIGVLRYLDREGFRVKAIAGTSAGGLWGCLYAAGYSPGEILDIMSGLDPDTLYRRQPGDSPAMLGLTGITQMLDRRLGGLTFQDLHIPFAVTAVNLDTAQAVVIKTGLVKEAVLATIAVPGIFPSRRLDNQTLIDGGILNPVPVAVARSLAPGLPVVAVVLSPTPEEFSEINRARLFDNMPFMSKYFARLRLAQAFNTFLRSVDIAGVLLTEMILEKEKPEYIIRPAVGHIGLLDEVDVNQVAGEGEKAAEIALANIIPATSWKELISRLKRRIDYLLRRDIYDA